MDSFAYFPAVVYRDERPDLANKVLPECLKELDQVRQPGWLMTQSNPLAQSAIVDEVSNYLLLASVDILRSQGYSVDKYDFYLSGVWAQEVINGAGTDVHIHKNSQICGWMFLETPENGAYPVYHDTRLNKAMIELDFVQGSDITSATSMIHFNNMQPGTVMLSNSWMRHQLVCGPSTVPTRCVHFIVSHKDR